MQLIEAFIRNPVKVSVGVLLVTLFGAIAMVAMPKQLTPEVQNPILTVETRWPGASPQEIEREIVQEQEEQLQSVEGLTKISSECMDSSGRIRLEFAVGTNIEDAMLISLRGIDANRNNSIRKGLLKQDIHVTVVRNALFKTMIEGTINAARSTIAGALLRSVRTMKIQTIETASPSPARKTGSVTAMKRASSGEPTSVNSCMMYSDRAVNAIAIAATIAATSDS